MDFTHRFSSRPMPISTVLEEYYKPAKVKKFGRQSRNIGKYWSNPPFKFNPEDILKKFKYLYIIGREYEIPRLDRQKTVGVRDVGNYRNQVNAQMEKESWVDMMNFEKDHPGTLALMPGPCLLCENKHLNCTRRSNKSCVEPGSMRFSMEGLGIDAETLAKFELGLLTRYPEESRLPMKMNCVMGFLSDDYIPLEEFKEYFPDAQKNYINFITSSGDQIEKKAKRQESWLDNQARQRRELEELAKAPTEWNGYKSSDMESGSIMQEKPWLNIEVEDENYENSSNNTPGLPLEHLGLENPNPSLPNEHLGYSEQVRSLPNESLGTAVEEAGLPNEHFHRTKITDFFEDEEFPPPKRDQSFSENFQKPDSEVFDDDPITEEDDDSKYKWLGFKRSLDEVEENFYNRPIRKFNIPDEEEDLETEEPPVALDAQDEPVDEEPIQDNSSEGTDSLSVLLENFSIDELKDIIAQKILAEQQKKTEELKNEEIPKEEEVVLPNAGSIDNVLGAALSIAKEVSVKKSHEEKEPGSTEEVPKWRRYFLQDES